jgi:hypothetical protein
MPSICVASIPVSKSTLRQQHASQHDRRLDGPTLQVDAGTITLTGDKAIARSMHGWLGLSPLPRKAPDA